MTQRRRFGWLLWIPLLPLLAGVDVLRRPNELVEQGNAAFKSGNAQQALELYQQAIQAGLITQATRPRIVTSAVGRRVRRMKRPSWRRSSLSLAAWAFNRW